MRTKLPIATISYLDEDYLGFRLNDALSSHLIDFWAYIKHKGDSDMKKDHIHVYAEPSKTIDTGSFNDRFVQIVPGEDLPRKCLQWRNSKFDDWYLYSIHDPDYLEMKGQKRNYRYSVDDVWASDIDELEYRISSIDYGKVASLNEIISAAVDQMSLAQALRSGIIPAGKVNVYSNLFRAIKYDSLSRNLSLDEKYKHTEV